MTHNETRISNDMPPSSLPPKPLPERLTAAAAALHRNAKEIGCEYSSVGRLIEEAAQALRSTPVDAEPISWLSFNDGSEPYLTGNQAEMIKLEATGPGPHALYARSLPNPSPSDGEVSREQAIACMAVELENNDSFARRPVNALVWATRLYDAAIQSSKGGQP